MIQRVQSIWLLLAALILIVMSFLPLLSKNIGGTAYMLYLHGVTPEMKNVDEAVQSFVPMLVLGLNVGLIILCLISIFMYKNRVLQKKLIVSTIILMFLMPVLLLYDVKYLLDGLEGISPAAGVFLLPFAIIFCLLAIRGIRKDEQLLRSADRLR